MLVYEIALFASCLNLFINYCIGKPGGNFSPYEIFSGYTVWLSKRRLIKENQFNQYKEQYDQSKKNPISKHDYHTMLYNAADPYFTWERMIGMCSVCTGFWVSLITGFCFTNNLVYLLSIIVISHLLIRIFNKFL